MLYAAVCMVQSGLLATATIDQESHFLTTRNPRDGELKGQELTFDINCLTFNHYMHHMI